MTYYEKMMAKATPNWMAYLLSNTWSCGECPCSDNCPKDNVVNCVKKITEHLESEVKK